MATKKIQVTQLKMTNGDTYIALEPVSVMEMKMNGLNVGKSVMQNVTLGSEPSGTYPSKIINLFHVVEISALTHEIEVAPDENDGSVEDPTPEDPPVEDTPVEEPPAEDPPAEETPTQE